jgi:Cytochrome b(C-terminal)/b6/petD
MPLVDQSRSRGLQFRPLSKVAFFVFLGNFLILMELGAKHVESPYIELGQICTAIYFLHFLVVIPVITSIENSLIELNKIGSENSVNLGQKEQLYSKLHSVVSKYNGNKNFSLT